MNDSIFIEINNKTINLFSKKDIGFDFFKSYQKHYLENPPSMIGTDLLYLGLVVLLADRRISRENAENSWTRNISIKIPVLNFDLFKSNDQLLVSILSFLTGDYWEVDFVKRDLTKSESKFFKITNHFEKSLFKEEESKRICMFSGGLDSYIGAIDLLQANSKNLIFATFTQEVILFLKISLNAEII